MDHRNLESFSCLTLRQIHSIVSNGNGKLLIIKRSCYCDSCLTQNYENCLNKNIVDRFTEHEMSLKSQPSERVTRSDDQADDSERIADVLKTHVRMLVIRTGMLRCLSVLS